MARSTARAAVMQLIYEQVLGGDGGDAALEMVYENLQKDAKDNRSEEDEKYIGSVLEGVKAHMADIDELIERFSVDWSIERMAKVDLTILRLAIYEMLYRDDVPTNVAINEAVELANLYSDPNGSRFVNGILGAIDRSQKKDS